MAYERRADERAAAEDKWCRVVIETTSDNTTDSMQHTVKMELRMSDMQGICSAFQELPLSENSLYLLETICGNIFLRDVRLRD